MVEDGVARRILVRQPPLDAGVQQVKDGINDALERIGLPPPGQMAARNQRLEQRPLSISEIAGAETGMSFSNMKQPASAAVAQHKIYSGSVSYNEQ
jgi:hypothetical protein